jgi:dihydroxyacetone kinase
VDLATVTAQATAEVTPASRRCARTATAILTAVAAAIEDAADELGRVDAVAGDGDHGRGMVKGTSAAVRAATAADQAGAGAATVLVHAGEAWANKAGGTSGVLWGAALAAVGERLGDDSAEITGSTVAAAVRAGLDAITSLGKAKVGDKTMVDALVPFVDTLERQTDAGAHLSAAWAAAADEADQAAQATARLKPRVGRARPLAERSLGTPDAGAVSFALCARTAGAVLGWPDGSQPRPRQPGWEVTS